MVETFMVFGEEPPICLESMLMAFPEELGVPGFAPDGFGPGDKLTPMDDFYLKMVTNVVAEDTPVADAWDEEVDLFFRSRRHLHSSVFDVERRAAATGDEWLDKVVYVLKQGGRFRGYAGAYNGAELIVWSCVRERLSSSRISCYNARPTGKASGTFIPIQRRCGGRYYTGNQSIALQPVHRTLLFNHSSTGRQTATLLA
jgi:hypothetical protein